MIYLVTTISNILFFLTKGKNATEMLKKSKQTTTKKTNKEKNKRFYGEGTANDSTSKVVCEWLC